MNPDPLKKIGKLLAHAAKADEAEARLDLEVAVAMLEEARAALQHEKIVAAASTTINRAALLERFRAALACGQAEGRLSPPGFRLLSILRESPPAPQGNYTTPAACAFFAWHRERNETISELISQL
jgi:hypothetical protein